MALSKRMEKLYWEGMHLAVTLIAKMGEAIRAIPWWKRGRVLLTSHRNIQTGGNKMDSELASYPVWGRLTSADVVGRIGLSTNEYGVTVTVFACESCLSLFTVTGDVQESTWGLGCLADDCDSYDVERDADLMFEIEPWRIRRD